jgi:hypothetical protein
LLGGGAKNMTPIHRPQIHHNPDRMSFLRNAGTMALISITNRQDLPVKIDWPQFHKNNVSG